MRETTSGAETFSSSKQTSTGTPEDINSVPIAPSPHSTEDLSSSKKSIRLRSSHCRQKLLPFLSSVSFAISLYQDIVNDARRAEKDSRSKKHRQSGWLFGLKRFRIDGHDVIDFG